MYLISRDGPCVHPAYSPCDGHADGRKAHPYWKESEGVERHGTRKPLGRRYLCSAAARRWRGALSSQTSSAPGYAQWQIDAAAGARLDRESLLLSAQLAAQGCRHHRQLSSTRSAPHVAQAP